MADRRDEVEIEDESPSFFENVGAGLVSEGIAALKTARPDAWAAFKASLKCVAVGSAALDEVTDDDHVTAEEIRKVFKLVQNFGASRTLEDMVWGLLKHIST
jgi:hypothetical protein